MEKTRRNLFFILVLLIAVLFLVNCNRKTNNKEDIEIPQIKESVNENAAITGVEINRIEDYDYLWSSLKESFLYWHEINEHASDIDEVIKKNREELIHDNTDTNLIISINKTLDYIYQKLDGHMAHLGFVDQNYYFDLYNGFNSMDAKDKYRNSPTFQLVNDSVTHSTYENIIKDKTMIKNIFAEGRSLKGMKGRYFEENIVYKLHEDKSVAYIRIGLFSSDNWAADLELLDKIYSQISNYEFLIIDITNNYGGNTQFVDESIIYPILKSDVNTVKYSLIKNSKNNTPYINFYKENTSWKFSDKTLIPFKDKINKDVFNESDEVLILDREFKVSDHNRVKYPFDGKIFLLTNEVVYSASEYLAVFCKQTGFATLVGTKTGGDGVGIEPIYIRLPNSGLLLSYSLTHGLNDDGSSNGLVGTEPDIELDDECLYNLIEYLAPTDEEIANKN